MSVFKRVSFFFKHGTQPPAATPPPAQSGDQSSDNAGNSIDPSSPASPGRSDTVISPNFKGTTHPTPVVASAHERFTNQKDQYDEFKSALIAHDKNLVQFSKDSAALSTAFETLSEGVGATSEWALEAAAKIAACRHNLEKATAEAPSVCSGNSSIFEGMEAGMQIFPKLQASYVKLGDLSLEMDHYDAKVVKVTAALEEADAAMQADPENEKLVTAKEKAAERVERNKQKLEEAKAAVQQASDEYLQFCEDTEEHRIALMNEQVNLPAFIQKQKEMFTSYEFAYSEEGKASASDIPPPSPDLVRRGSGGLAKISKGFRRRTIEAKQSIDTIKKHGITAVKGVKSGVYEVENEREYAEGEIRFLQLKKDISYLRETMERFPISLENMFDSLLSVAMAATVLANDCLTKDLVGGDDDFESWSDMAKARTNQLVDNINAIKAKLGSTAKVTACYLSDLDSKILMNLQPIPEEFPIVEPRFATRKQHATDFALYSQKAVDLDAAKTKLGEKEANEEKLQAAQDKITANNEKLVSTKALLMSETDLLIKEFEEFEKKRETILTDWFSFFATSTNEFWGVAAASTLSTISVGGADGTPKAVGGPSAPPPAAAPPPQPDADGDDEDAGNTLKPPARVSEQGRRDSSARLSNEEVAKALEEEIKDVKELGFESPPVPQVRKMSERNVRTSDEEEGEGGAQELNHVNLAKSQFGDGTASEMLKEAEKKVLEKTEEVVKKDEEEVVEEEKGEEEKGEGEGEGEVVKKDEEVVEEPVVKEEEVKEE
ncbi:hypothetical protein TrST_g5996 [Triparma strigata]|uniref:BAR domain-containing protein n=1 Tax=Triparma strigata TaxID=1606541 RepID=A0A9W7ER16_9STRA|nr:hypothetical protein TrST_g5996 [Triparma strigata]